MIFFNIMKMRTTKFTIRTKKFEEQWLFSYYTVSFSNQNFGLRNEILTPKEKKHWKSFGNTFLFIVSHNQQ